MKKIIDETKLVIPPHISTLWVHVKALFVKQGSLIVDLNNGESIAIPGLSEEELSHIFSCHATFLEKEPSQPGKQENPFRFSLSSFDGMKSAMRHNPEQAHFPKLPDEILSRIAQIAKLLSPEQLEDLDPAVENCNCMYCQVSRAMQALKSPKEEEPEVTSDDLKFQDWEIKEISTNLYEVTSRLNHGETYRVFLGDPIGCTCGTPHCEHIIAVLKS